MRILLLVCLLVAFTTVFAKSGAWKTNYEYRYKLHTRTLTSLPKMQNQWVGLFTRADFTVRSLSEDLLVGKVQNGEYAEWNDAIPTAKTYYEVPEKDLSYETMTMNSKPFEIRLKNGVISSIAVDKTMTNTELNQLKGLVSQLQVDLHAQNLIKCQHNQLPQFDDKEGNQAVYKVMEPTITGDCETLYDIVKVPEYLVQTYPEYTSNIHFSQNEQFYEITKTKNYSNCDQRMGYHFGVSGLSDWKANTNSMGSLSKSAISRIIITGTYSDYTIRSSTTTNRVVKENPNNEEYSDVRGDSMVVSYVNLTLVSMVESQSTLKPQTEELVDVGSLVYTYDLKNEKKQVSEHSTDEHRQYGKSLNGEEETANFENDNEYNQQEKKVRNPRSIDENELNFIQKKYHGDHFNSVESMDSDSAPEHDSESDSTDSSHEHYQPQPTLESAPGNPLLPFFVGINGKSIQDKLNVSQEVIKLAYNIAEDMETPEDLPKKNTLWKFNILARTIRTMSFDQISETSRQLVIGRNDYGKKVWKVYRDAVVNAGTGPAVDEVMKWIENSHLKGEEAVEIIATLPKTIREPTERLQKRFFEFVKNDVVRKEPFVNITAGVALTRFLYRSQVNNKTANKYYPVEIYGRLSNRKSNFVVEEVIPYFDEELKTAISENDNVRTLYAIRALGNLGHSIIPTVFEPYFEGKVPVTTFQRLAMIVALDKYIVNYPRNAQTLLFKIYQNRGDVSEVRVAAVFQLMRTNPSAALLQRMAEQTNTDESRDVRAAVQSALESASKLENPEHQQLRQNAKSAMDLLKHETLGLQYSRTYLRDYVVKQIDATYESQMSYIVNRDSFVPNAFFAKTEKSIGGFKRHDEYQAMVSSVEKLVRSLEDKFFKTDLIDDDYDYMENDGATHQGTQNTNTREWTEKIGKMLNLEPKVIKKLEGQLLFTVMNTKRFIPFDEETLKRLPRMVQEYLETMKNGREMNYTKVFYDSDTTISFPLETGLPFIFTYRKPTLVQIDGKIFAETTPKVYDETTNKLRMPEMVKLNGDLHVVYSTLHEITVGFINPFTQQLYKSGFANKLQTMLPIRVMSNINLRQREMVTEVEPMKTDKSIPLLHISSWPFTGRKDVFDLRPIADSKHAKLISVRTPREINHSFGKKWFGVEFTIKGRHEKQFNDLTAVFDELHKNGPRTFYLFGQRVIAPEHYNIELFYNPTETNVNAAKFTFKYDKKRADSSINVPTKESRHPRSLNANEHLAIPDSAEPNNVGRREQFLKNVVNGLNTNNADVFDFSMQFGKEQTIIDYIFTIATASSPTDEKTRLLLFFNKRSSDSTVTPKTAYLQLDTKYQTVPKLERVNLLNRDVSAVSDIKFIYGNPVETTIDRMPNIRAKVTMQQSPELKEYLNTVPYVKYIERANTLDRMRVEVDDIKISHIPMDDRLAIYKLYNIFRLISFPNLREEVHDFNPNEPMFTLESSIAPTMQTINFTITTPYSKSEWRDVRVPKAMVKAVKIPFVLKAMPLVQRFKHQAIKYADTCLINKFETKTFDNQTVKHNLGDGWYIAVDKMSPIKTELKSKHDGNVETTNNNKYNSQLSILVRDLPEDAIKAVRRESNTEYENQPIRKILKIVSHDNDVVLEMRPDTRVPVSTSPTDAPHLYVNGQALKVAGEMSIQSKVTNQPWAKAYITPNGELNVQTVNNNKRMEVLYNGQRVLIRSNSIFRKNRGICGAFTGEPKVDLKTPTKQILRDDNDFVTSWAVLDTNSSQQLRQLQQQVKQQNHPREEVLYQNIVANKHNMDQTTQTWSERAQHNQIHFNMKPMENSKGKMKFIAEKSVNTPHKNLKIKFIANDDA